MFFDMACLFNYTTREGKTFPCGQCPQCRKRRTDSWVFRMMCEADVSTSAHFVTLTYDDIHLPISPNGYMTLDKTHVQLFIKRLRYYLESYGVKIVYYNTGEYGTKFKRPHYHLIIFNLPADIDPIDIFAKAWVCSDTGSIRGSVFLGDTFTNDAVAYTVGYINKRRGVKLHERDDRVPEYSTMSKGIGKSYLDNPEVVRFHQQHPSNNFIITPLGNKIAMPRYFADRLFNFSSLETKLPFKEMQQAHLDAIGRVNPDARSEFITRTGDTDPKSFFKSRAEAKRVAITNFQNRSLNRKE